MKSHLKNKLIIINAVNIITIKQHIILREELLISGQCLCSVLSMLISYFIKNIHMINTTFLKALFKLFMNLLF